MCKIYLDLNFSTTKASQKRQFELCMMSINQISSFLAMKFRLVWFRITQLHFNIFIPTSFQKSSVGMSL